jgi:CheY-like chemotaxis protein
MADPIPFLLVDDKPQNLTVLESVLDTPEYRLVKAGSAEEAFRAILSNDFAAVLRSKVAVFADLYREHAALAAENDTLKAEVARLRRSGADATPRETS